MTHEGITEIGRATKKRDYSNAKVKVSIANNLPAGRKIDLIADKIKEEIKILTNGHPVPTYIRKIHKFETYIKLLKIKRDNDKGITNFIYGISHVATKE